MHQSPRVWIQTADPRCSLTPQRVNTSCGSPPLLWPVTVSPLPGWLIFRLQGHHTAYLSRLIRTKNFLFPVAFLPKVVVNLNHSFYNFVLQEMLASDYFEVAKEYPMSFLFTRCNLCQESSLTSAGDRKATGKLSEIQAQLEVLS